MFLLSIIEDKISILPNQFDKTISEVLVKQIEKKYVNKIILDVGLCISFYDFIEVGEPYLYPSEGSSIQLIKFRMIVFRPFAGEIITGKILKSSLEGIRVTLGFFEEILIPRKYLQNPSTFDTQTMLWTWKYGENSEVEFILEPGEEIRFKVKEINFTGLSSSSKGVTATTITESQEENKTDDMLSNNSSFPPISLRRRSSSVDLATDDEIPSAMQIVGSINDYGLGITSWW